MGTRWMGRIELKREENLNKREQTGGKLLKKLVGDGQKEAKGKEKISQKYIKKKEQGGGRGGGGRAKLGQNWVFMQKLLLFYYAIEEEKANEVKLKEVEGLKKCKEAETLLVTCGYLEAQFNSLQ